MNSLGVMVTARETKCTFLRNHCVDAGSIVRSENNNRDGPMGGEDSQRRRLIQDWRALIPMNLSDANFGN
jgi:hypothetical protein